MYRLLKFTVLALGLLCTSKAGATTRYVAQTAGVFSGGTACNTQTAITPATFNGLTLAAGDLTWVCGTITGSAGATILTIGQNGSSGSPITLRFDTGAIIQAPYCSGTNGCIDAHGRSWITIDGNSLAGTVQNTANGDGLANQHISVLIDTMPCSNCVIQNLNLLSNYVANTSLTSGVVTASAGVLTYVSGAQFNTVWAAGTSLAIGPSGTCSSSNNAGGCTFCTVSSVSSALSMAITGTGCSAVSGTNNYQWALGGSATQMNAITLAGQNPTVSGNTITDCGWCILDEYVASDTNHVIATNTITNWDHAVLYATSSAVACTAPCLFEHDNQIQSNVNWETYGCIYHLDGIHTFGVSGSTMNGVYMYNNWYHGTMSGACSSGFIFMEQGSPSQSNASNVSVWNNVFDASAADGINPNGWVGIFSGVGGTTSVLNNTLLCPSSTDNSTVGWGIQQQGANIIFEGNLENKCPQGNSIKQGAGTLTADYNAYGNPCASTGNCWVWNSAVFEGSFSAWKTACSCDAHSQTTASDAALKLNTNGSLQSGSPAIQQAVNLTTTATGNLATLANSTTLGGTVGSPNTRPTGSCVTQGTSTCWDEGAFAFSSAGTIVATPVISPTSGNVPQTVTITDSTPSAVICYSTTGAATATVAGTCDQSTYSGPLSISVASTLRTIGTLVGATNSSQASATYTSGTGATNGNLSGGVKLSGGAKLQ